MANDEAPERVRRNFPAAINFIDGDNGDAMGGKEKKEMGAEVRWKNGRKRDLVASLYLRVSEANSVEVVGPLAMFCASKVRASTAVTT